MPRPRLHDLDAVLDRATELAVTAGPAAVTIRALSEATSVSNGALYHAFGSRGGLLGRAWLRAADKFLTLQRDTVDHALEGDPVEAVVQAALCPAAFFDQDNTAAQFLFMVSRDELLRTGDMPEDITRQLHRGDDALVAIFIRLSLAMWNRRDRSAVDLIRDCIVELPTSLLLRHAGRYTDAAARERLDAAVRAVLTIPPTTP